MAEVDDINPGSAVSARYRSELSDSKGDGEQNLSQLREEDETTADDDAGLPSNLGEEKRDDDGEGTVLCSVEGGSLRPPVRPDISSEDLLNDPTLDVNPNDPISKADLHRMWMDFKRLKMTFVVRCKYQICSILSGPLQELWQNNLVLRGIVMRRMQCMHCRSR